MATNEARAMPRPISVGNGEFRIDGKAAALYGGAMHYWRLDRDKWSGILDSVVEMGFTTISIYMPWEAHEIERGKFDFGQVDPRTDLDAFLTLIESKGLNIVARPGPQINSEMTWFGYPGRILADPELQALNALGTQAVLTQVPRPIPALSYAVDKFFDETALWYDAIMPILAKHAYPKGRLVAVQVDNEMAFFFHVNAYACDFHPASIAWYQRLLEEKYGSIADLNAVYGTSHGSFATVDPPRRFEAKTAADIPWYTDWIEFRERYLVGSMERLAVMMRERGLGDVALFHNYPHPLGPGGAASGFTTPFDLMGLEEKLDFVGFDVYSRKELYEHVKTVLSYVVGTSRYPYIPEFIAGVWPWYLNPGTIYDEEFVTKAAFMQGIKGFSRYMLVERDRWLDSPIRADGRVRVDHAEMFGRANEVLTGNGFVDLRRKADVLLMANRDYDRLEAACVLISFPGDFLETPSGFSEYPNYMTVAERDLGFAQPIQVAKADRFTASYRGLYTSGFAYLLSDSKLAPERWRAYKALVLATYEFLGGALQRDLVAYVRLGGTAVLGPTLPTLDAAMRPDSFLKDAVESVAGSPVSVAGRRVGTSYAIGTGRVVVLEDLGDAAAALKAALVGLDLVRFERSDTRLDVAIHTSESDPSRAIVFIANPTPDPIDATVRLRTPVRSALELWDDAPFETADGALKRSMPPYSIAIVECQL